MKLLLIGVNLLGLHSIRGERKMCEAYAASEELKAHDPTPPQSQASSLVGEQLGE